MSYTLDDPPDSFRSALARHARDGTGATITVIGRSDGEERVDYARLAALAGGTARQLSRLGIGAGDRVAVIMVSSLPVIVAISALFALGATLLPVAHRKGFKPGSYAYGVAASSLRAGAPRCVLVPQALVDVVVPLLVAEGIQTWHTLEDIVGAEDDLPGPAGLDAPRVIQFSSGTTVRPKAIVMGEDRLIDNVSAIIEQAGVSNADHTYSWLPLFHDMGLVGGLLTSLYLGSSLTLASPTDFLRNPLRWTAGISKARCSVTIGPPSAYALLASKARVRPDLLADTDVSSLRLAMTGSEMVPPGLAGEFHQALAAAGLREHALQPCYGLAENGVAVTIRPPGRPWRVIHVRRSALDLSRVELAGAADADTLTRVGNGAPIRGTEILIGHRQGDEIIPAAYGELHLRGRSAARAVLDADGNPLPKARGDWIATGDLAIEAHGELFIVGRVKELIKYGGQGFVPTDIEQAVATACAVPADAVATVSVFDPTRAVESLVVFIETAEADARERLTSLARQAVLAAFRIPVGDVVVVRPGKLPRTSSGKLRRADLGAGYRSTEPLGVV